MLWCMGVLGMSDSVGSRRGVLYVQVVVEVVLGIHWWSMSQCWWSQERTEGLSGCVGGPMDELKV